MSPVPIRNAASDTSSSFNPVVAAFAGQTRRGDRPLDLELLLAAPTDLEAGHVFGWRVTPTAAQVFRRSFRLCAHDGP